MVLSAQHRRANLFAPYIQNALHKAVFPGEELYEPYAIEDFIRHLYSERP